MYVRIMFDSTPDDGESSTYSARLFLDSDDAPRIETLGFSLTISKKESVTSTVPDIMMTKARKNTSITTMPSSFS